MLRVNQEYSFKMEYFYIVFGTRLNFIYTFYFAESASTPKYNTPTQFADLTI